MTRTEYEIASKKERWLYKIYLTLRKSLACLRLKIWDEKQQEIVPFP
jgi:hypothetical protein